jgi:four helix bundle protein
MERARNFRNYKVWQDAVEYSTKIYQQTDKMPWFEKKGLCDQLQRAAVSIGSNIAEGCGRNSDKELIRFCWISMGSLSEVETQLIIARELGFVDDTAEIEQDIRNVRKILSGFIYYIQNKQ